jgi:hypothetical protein
VRGVHHAFALELHTHDKSARAKSDDRRLVHGRAVNVNHGASPDYRHRLEQLREERSYGLSDATMPASAFFCSAVITESMTGVLPG